MHKFVIINLIYIKMHGEMIKIKETVNSTYHPLTQPIRKIVLTKDY